MTSMAAARAGRGSAAPGPGRRGRPGRRACRARSATVMCGHELEARARRRRSASPGTRPAGRGGAGRTAPPGRRRRRSHPATPPSGPAGSRTARGPRRPRAAGGARAGPRSSGSMNGCSSVACAGTPTAALPTRRRRRRSRPGGSGERTMTAGRHVRRMPRSRWAGPAVPPPRTAGPPSDWSEPRRPGPVDRQARARHGAPAPRLGRAEDEDPIDLRRPARLATPEPGHLPVGVDVVVGDARRGGSPPAPRPIPRPVRRGRARPGRSRPRSVATSPITSTAMPSSVRVGRRSREHGRAGTRGTARGGGRRRAWRRSPCESKPRNQVRSQL